MSIKKQTVDPTRINHLVKLPYSLRVEDFTSAMQDVYDFFYDVNNFLLDRGLQRLDDMLRPANLSGTLSDMLTESLAKHSRSLTPNLQHNGHPDLLVRDRYPNNKVAAGEFGVEVKTTRKRGGAVDTHGARDQTLTTFVYTVDNDRSKSAMEREPLTFREVYCATVEVQDFRANARGPLGTRTATLHAAGIERYRREGLIYHDRTTTEGMSAWRR